MKRSQHNSGAPKDLAAFKQMIASRQIVFPDRLERVARLAFDRPEAVAFGTLQSVAKECAVATSTVFRAARAAGFDGFSDFKLLFERHIRSQRRGK